MLVAAVIRLQSHSQLKLPLHTGRSTHGCFFNLLDRFDPTLAQTLHDESTNRAKGFTISGLLPVSRRESCYDLRVTSIEQSLSATLLDRVIPDLPSQLQVGSNQFSVEACFLQHADHPLAGCIDPGQLTHIWSASSNTPPRWLKLEFLSPTTFSSNGKRVALPLPRFVFGGYADRWGDILGEDFPLPIEAIRGLVEEQVNVDQYQLQTYSAPLEYGAPITGFIGKCEFSLMTQDIELQRLLHLLAEFSFWCGTGYKTTMGLGQTRSMYKPLWNSAVATTTLDTSSR